MLLINLIVILIIVGILLYFINNFIPMDAKIKNIINVVVIVAIVLWLLSLFLGVGLGSLSTIRIGR